MSEKIEKVIDISKYKLGDRIPILNCPRCKTKGEFRLVGLYNRLDKSHEVECTCFLTERVNPMNVEFAYEPPKEPKKKKSEVES